MEKKLYRIKEGKMIAGVCTGFAEYFKLDVNIVRLILVLLSCSGGLGIVAYIAAAILVPEEPANLIDAE